MSTPAEHLAVPGQDLTDVGAVLTAALVAKVAPPKGEALEQPAVMLEGGPSLPQPLGGLGKPGPALGPRGPAVNLGRPGPGVRPGARPVAPLAAPISARLADVAVAPTRPVESDKLHNSRAANLQQFLDQETGGNSKLAVAAGKTGVPVEQKQAHERVRAALGELKNLAATKKLGGGKLDDSTVRSLKEIQAEMMKWFKLMDPAAAETTSAGRDELIAAFGVIREELLDSSLAVKAERQSTLAQAGDTLEKKADGEPALNLVKALKGYRAAMDARPRDGKAITVALGSLSEACKKVPDSSAVAQDAASLLASANAEMADIESVKQAVTKLRQPAAGWKADAQEGVFTDANTVKGFRIESGTGIGGKEALGKKGTAGRQAQQLVDLLEVESARSNVVATLLQDLVDNEHPVPLTMRLGENSAGFFDNPATMGVDMDDLVSMPAEPVKVKKADGSEVAAGVTKSELLLHILEERLQMQRGQTYEQAHETCLSPNSYQNQFRRELGIDTDSVVFDCHEHAGCKDKSHSHKAADAHGGPAAALADFVPLDSGGVQMTIPNIRFRKDNDAGGTHSRPQQAEVTYVHDDGAFEKCKNQVWAMLLAALRKAVEGGQSFTTQWSESPARSLLALLEKQYPHDELEAQKTAIEQAVRTETDRYKKEWAAKRQVWKADTKEKTKAAREYVAQEPQEPLAGNTALKLLRELRPAAGLNDAGELKENIRNSVYSNQSEENCGCVTLGALFGEKSSEIAMRVLKKNGYNEGDVKQFAAVQDQSVFYRAKNRGLKTGVGDPLPDGRKMPDDKSSEVGDEQFDGIRGLLKDLVAERNDPNGKMAKELAQRSAGKFKPPKFKAVQDGVPDTPDKGGRMYPVDELKARMAKFPDGTQFQVFVRGAKMSGHWLYAEKYNGKLVMEDYQKANLKKAEQTSYVDQLPQHPNSDEPDVFEQGMFFAVVPMPDGADTLQGIDEPFVNAKFAQL